MLLSSLNRLKYYVSTVESGDRDTLESGVANDSELLGWLISVSDEVERYLNRSIEITSRTEYYDIEYKKVQYFLEAYPIVSITSVYSDSKGLYDGNESEETDYYIGANDMSVVLQTPISYLYKKGLRVIYIGGLAYDPVLSVFAISDSTGTWTVDKYVQGQSSNSFGIVKVVSDSSISIENIYGKFIAGETIQEQDSEGTQGDSDGSATISSITRQSLAEAYPAITRATELEIRYMWKHKLDMENDSTQFEGTRRRAYDSEYNLQPETQMMLKAYRNAILV